MGHEEFHRSERVKGSSNRSFGLVFAAVFTIVAFLPLLDHEAPRWWSLGVAIAFAVVALVYPRILALPNKAWSKLGILLGLIVSPIALGVLFAVAFVPIGAFLRIRGNDPLRLRRDPRAASYWVPRTPPGPPRNSMTEQF